LRRPVTSLIAVVLAAGTIAGAASARPAESTRAADTNLTLVAYSTPREAYGQIIPLFQKTAAGKDVSFEQCYGSSGEQSRAVIAGLAADVVALSLEPDVTDLVAKGLVDKSWNKGFYKGMVTTSVVVFAVRDGNPKKIRNWSDLIKPGVEVLTPNPLTSGGARWNVMAAYGAQRKLGKTDKQAQDYLLKLFQHVTVQDKSARESLQTFLGGKGDVLLANENEAFSRPGKLRTSRRSPSSCATTPGMACRRSRSFSTDGLRSRSALPPACSSRGSGSDCWRPGPAVGRRSPRTPQWAPAGSPRRLQVLGIEDGGIADVVAYLQPDLVPRVGLPARLES
jgi:ABC-type molybdate transport system substrate-binding protein